MASVRGILNIQSLNESTHEKYGIRRGYCPPAPPGCPVCPVCVPAPPGDS